MSTLIAPGPALNVRTVPDAVQAAGIHDVEEKFLDLVYADEELLRAEFDTIIAEEWGQPTPPPPQRPTHPPAPAPQRRKQHRESASRRPGRQHHRAGEGRSRQRAPPASATVSPPAMHLMS